MAFFAISFRLLDFGVCATTCSLVILPPRVQRRRSSIHGSLHVAKVGFTLLAGPITPPPVLPVHINLIVEAVVDSNLGPTGFVDPVHVFAELRSMAISVPVILCHKQERVNHFMEKGLYQVFSGSKLQQRLTQPD